MSLLTFWVHTEGIQTIYKVLKIATIHLTSICRVTTHVFLCSIITYMLKCRVSLCIFPIGASQAVLRADLKAESSIYLLVASCLQSDCTGDANLRPQRVHHPSANEVSFHAWL